MNNVTTVKTGTIFGVYMIVSIFCVYMDMKKPRTSSQRTKESQQSIESLEVTWAENEKEVEYRKTNKWHVFNTYTETVDVRRNVHSAEDEGGGGGGEVQYDYFRSEQVKRIKNKSYTEIFKDKFSNVKKFPPENYSFVSQKILRKRAHLNQSNAYDQLIHLITLPTSQTVFRKTFSSPLLFFLPTSFTSLLPTLNPTFFSPLRLSSSTTASSFKCSFASHSSSSLCKKKTKYCVKPPIALKTNLHFPDIQTEGPTHLNVNKGGHLGNLNANPLIGNCPEVIQRQLGRLGREWEGVGVIENIIKDRHSDVCINNLKTRMKTKEKKIDEGKNIEDIRISLTIDASSNFVQDANDQHFPRSLVLDLMFDLAGLNSLHKHDIIASLVQVLQQRVVARGYQLVASSAKEGDLLQYFHQEGFPPPLLVHSFWWRPHCICNCSWPMSLD